MFVPFLLMKMMDSFDYDLYVFVAVNEAFYPMR